MKNNRQRRDALVDRVATVLAIGRPTPYRYEAACRHGLRREFILNASRSWLRADLEAEAIVAEALRRVGGGVRPSWQEGQKSYGVPREACLRCSAAIDPDDDAVHARWGYCSDLCQVASRLHHDLRDASFDELAAAWVSARGHAAVDASQAAPGTCRHCGSHFWGVPHQAFCSTTCANRAHAGEALLADRACEHCGKTFRPDKRGRKYCSHACYAAAERVHQDRACRRCHGQFRPRRDDQLFCSDACRLAARRTALPERRCDECGEAFRPYHARARYCSVRCNARAAGRRRTERARAARNNQQGDVHEMATMVPSASADR